MFWKKSKAKFNINDNKRVAFFIVVFVFALSSMIILYPKTMLSIKNTIILSLLFLFIDIVVIELKTKIRHVQTYVALCFTTLLTQLSILLWLNLISLGTHIEKYKIIGTRSFDKGQLLQLEGGVYKDFFLIRYQNIDMRMQDSITYYFKDGLLGFKVLQEVK